MACCRAAARRRPGTGRVALAVSGTVLVASAAVYLHTTLRGKLRVWERDQPGPGASRAWLQLCGVRVKVCAVSPLVQAHCCSWVPLAVERLVTSRHSAPLLRAVKV